MAPPAVTSYQALVALEKGHPGSPKEQLREAGRIVGIDLDCHDDGRYENRDDSARAQSFSAPKEEWVLRWLMKKLKGSRDEKSEYRVDNYSWILLRALFCRIPPRPLAAILSEYKILGLLDESLGSLGGVISDGDDAGLKALRKGSPDPQSSKRGRKRKRTETVADDRVCDPPVDLLLVVLESVDQLVALLSRIPGNQAAVRSQLKLALRGEPDLAARILGKALCYAADAVHLGEADAPQRMLCSLLSMVSIWEYRSDDSAKLPGNDSFTSHILSPALRFIFKSRSLPQSANKQAITHALERLIVLHAIFPLRERFFTLKPAAPATGNHANPEKVGIVSDEIDARFPAGTHGELLPILLNIAIRAVPRDTFRRQINEAPWLETLFVALAARLGCSIDTEAPQDVPKETISFLQQLLQVAIDRKSGISLQTLAQYASRFSGLMRDGEDSPHWRLITQLIEINVDIFLPNSGYPESKILLEKLIDHITSECLRFSSRDAETCDIIKTGIAVPLLRGFSGARDLETFVEIWKAQLVILESARSSEDDPYCYSVWEDDDLAKTYGDLVSTAVPIGHMKGEMENLTSGVQSPPLSEDYARIIFLDAFLLSNPRPDGSVVDAYLFDKVFTTICSLLSSKESLHWRWRLWRINQNLFEKFPLSTVQVPADLTTSVLPGAIKTLQSFHQKFRDSGVRECREAYCSFQFVVTSLSRTDISQGNEYLNTLVSSSKRLLSIVGETAEPAWNGRIETLQEPPTVAVGYLTIFLAHPTAVVRLTSTTRRLLFTTILSTLSVISEGDSLLSVDKATAGNLGLQLVEVWKSLLSPDWLLAAAPAVFDLASVIQAQFTSSKTMRPLLLNNLLSIPTRLIPAHLRVTILDSLQSILVDDRHTRDVELALLALLKRLVESPKSSARIITDWEGLWKVADSISLQWSENRPSTLQAFRQLQKSVVGRIMISSESHRREYIQKTGNKVSSLSGMLTSAAKYESMNYFMFCLSLDWVHSNRSELGDSSKIEAIDSLREKTFETSLSDLQSLARRAKKQSEELNETVLFGSVSVLDTFPDLLRASKDARKAIQKLDEYIGKGGVGVHAQKLVKRQCVARLKAGPKILPEIIDRAPSFPINYPYAAEQSSFVHEIRLQVSSMKGKKLVELVRNIRQAGFGDDQASYRLVLTGIAASSFAPIESRESPEAVELSSILTTLANSLSQFTSIEPFCLATECVDLLLRTHPKSVSQWNIDNLLAAMSVATSKSGPQISREYAGTIYSRLGRLLGTLFGLYRKKLSGRFHLILPPLQRLLRCFFTRDSRATKSSPLMSELPPWIGNLDETPLQAHHAGEFCRLLTSLCDPTVSAVQLQRGQANQGLSDSTKKVKSLAGQYLQYLIMEYAGSQLRGHLSPQMKAALMPGMYAVLDVMARHTMRAMNAAMDSSSRAMFKNLYDDYVRFGKWNHD